MASGTSFLGDVFWGEGLYFCVNPPADEVSPFAGGIFAALVMMYYWRQYYVVGNNDFDYETGSSVAFLVIFVYTHTTV
jgi:hypothetical protein